MRFEAELTAGLVYLGPEDIGPGVDLTLDLSWPEFPVRTLTSYLRGGFDMNVRQGYKYYSPEGEIGVIWSPLRPFRLTVGYEVSYFGLYENRLDDTALSDLPSDDIVFDDGYLQSVLKQELVLDLRDNLLAPGRGLFASVSVDEALPPGRFRYVKVIGDLRGYVPLGTPRFVLALRGTGSYIGTYGDEDSVPIEEAIFAGGDGSVRGWKSRQLGPRAVEEDCSRRDCIIPLGGKVGFTGALELRGNPVAGLWLAGFTDFGRVWSSPEEIDAAARFFEDLQFTVGGGIRYDLAIGRLRLDFGIHPRAWTDEVFLARLYKPKTCETLDSCPEDERLEPPTWSFHFGIGESF